MAQQFTPLPDPPSRADPANFAAKGDAFLGALPQFQTEANIIGNEAEANGIFAETKAQEAAASAANALTSENNAAASASNALNSANNAANSALEAFNTLDSFQDVYLGALANDPTVDNDGDPVQAGAIYFNTSIPEFRVFNGAAWQATVGSITGEFFVARDFQTATAGQTVFNTTTGYNVGTNTLVVFINGVRVFNSEYVETNGNTVTFNQPLNAGDEVLFEIGLVAAGDVESAGLVQFSPTTIYTAGNVQDALTEAGTAIQSNTSNIATNTANIAAVGAQVDARLASLNSKFLFFGSF